jgi:type IV secretory pathway protease TraF
MGKQFWLKRAAWIVGMIGGMIVETVAMTETNVAIHGKNAGRKRGPAATSGIANRKGGRSVAPTATLVIEHRSAVSNH